MYLDGLLDGVIVDYVDAHGIIVGMSGDLLVLAISFDLNGGTQVSQWNMPACSR